MVEAAQLLLGLSIPLLVANHLIGTRLMAEFAGFDDSYLNMLRLLWPGLAVGQIVLLLVVWAHGVIGVWFVARDKAWFVRARGLFLVLAVVIPLMAVAGFVAGGREAHMLGAPPVVISERHFALFGQISEATRTWLWAGAGAIGLALGARLAWLRWRPTVSVRYSGHGTVTSPKGLTLLEMSRLHDVPHPSACGGRGRCSTCRVMIISGGEGLPEPVGIERRLLDRIRAPQHVRLACQIKPHGDLAVRMLMPAVEDKRRRLWHAQALEWGAERELTVLFADIRGFSNLARHQSATDLTRLLNRLIDDMAQATELRGGRIAMIETDGVMAVFGLDGRAGAGARGAVEAAADILQAIEQANDDVGLAVTQPVRVGVGVHTGPVIAAEIGDRERGFQLVAIGAPVVIAHRLEEATKEVAADCLISADTIEAAGLAGRASRGLKVAYKNGEAPQDAFAFAARADMETLLRRRGAGRAEAPEETSGPAQGDAAEALGKPA